MAQWNEAVCAKCEKCCVGHACLVKRGEKKRLTLLHNQEKKMPDKDFELKNHNENDW